MSNERHFMPRARDAIERGLAFGHAEAYLASAAFKLNIADPIGAARDLGTALVRGPMLAQAHEMAGRILVEVDAITEARAHFETAMRLDPTRAHFQLVDLARLDALEGFWDRADAAVERVVNDPDKSIAQLASIFKARLASWRGDRAAMFAATTVFAPRMGPQASRLLTFITQAAESQMIDPTVWKQFLAVFGGADRPIRSQLIGLQVVAELALTLDRTDLALETLDQAEKLGLMDVVVLDRCPLFDRVVNEGRFRALRKRVAQRAADVLAAFRSATL
jgi:serine/threonine-protein kinase